MLLMRLKVVYQFVRYFSFILKMIICYLFTIQLMLTKWNICQSPTF